MNGWQRGRRLINNCQKQRFICIVVDVISRRNAAAALAVTALEIDDDDDDNNLLPYQIAMQCSSRQ